VLNALRNVGRALSGELGWRMAASRLARDSESEPFVKAFVAVRKHTLSTEEAPWFSKIESLRRELRRSAQLVPTKDYRVGLFNEQDV